MGRRPMMPVNRTSGVHECLKEGCWSPFQGQYHLLGRNVWPRSARRLSWAGPPPGYPVRSGMVVSHFTGTDRAVGSSQAASYLCVRTPADAFRHEARHLYPRLRALQRD